MESWNCVKLNRQEELQQLFLICGVNHGYKKFCSDKGTFSVKDSVLENKIL